MKSSFEELEEEDVMGNIPISGTLIETPLGIFIKDDALNPYKRFEFWIGNTNFDITKGVASIIMATPGVEIFQVLTRYQFLLGVGQLFTFQDVRSSLQQQLCGTTFDLNALTTRINSIEATMQELEYPEWAIYIFPNGEIDFTYLEKDESNLQEYNNKKAQLIEASTLSKGKLYLHERQDRTITPEEE